MGIKELRGHGDSIVLYVTDVVVLVGGIKLIFDLDKTGLLRIFLAWQVEAMKYLWGTQKPVKSKDVHLYLEQKGIRTVRGSRNTVSRASVINFLNSLVDEGVVTYTEDTGKGGHHRVYSLAESTKTKDAFKLYVQRKTLAALQTFIKNE